MEKYTCETCGKRHTVYRSLDVSLPTLISEMSEEEREKRIREVNGFYTVDDELLFANGWVNIEVENYDFPFYYWKTWTSISKKEFLSSLDDLKTGSVIEFCGNLAAELPFYSDSIGLTTKTLIQMTNEGLIVEIQALERSKLKQDQSKPISEKRMIEIMQMIHHNPQREEKREFTQPFNQRLMLELETVENKYIKLNKNFGIDISSNTVLFQIISNKLIESPKSEKSGFALHLSFDEAFDESIEEISKFRTEEYSKEFDYLVLDEIPTFQIDLGMDKERLGKLVSSIVTDIYGENLETIEVDHFEI